MATGKIKSNAVKSITKTYNSGNSSTLIISDDDVPLTNVIVGVGDGNNNRAFPIVGIRNNKWVVNVMELKLIGQDYCWVAKFNTDYTVTIYYI